VVDHLIGFFSAHPVFRDVFCRLVDPEKLFGSLAKTPSCQRGVVLPNPARYRSGRKVSQVSGLQDLKVIALDRAIGHFLVHNPGTQLATGKIRLPQNPTIQPPGLDPVTDNSVLGFS
jgi:hypothetical protein